MIIMIIAVIPAHNEEKTVAWVIEETKKYADKIIFIDDGSTDDTLRFAKNTGAEIIHHECNRGLGASLRAGFNRALETAREDDIIITLDADGQHNPHDIPKLVKKLEHGYEFVLGQRDLRNYPFVKKFGNFFLNLICKFYLCNEQISRLRPAIKTSFNLLLFP